MAVRPRWGHIQASAASFPSTIHPGAALEQLAHTMASSWRWWVSPYTCGPPQLCGQAAHRALKGSQPPAGSPFLSLPCLSAILHCCSLSEAQANRGSLKHHHLCYSLWKKQNISNSAFLLTEQQARDKRSSQVHFQTQISVSIHKHTSPP